MNSKFEKLIVYALFTAIAALCCNRWFNWHLIPESLNELIAYIGIIFIVAYLCIAHWFIWYVGPKSFRNWADNIKTPVVKMTRGGFRDFSKAGASYHQLVYRVVVQDKAGVERKGWVILGNHWGFTVSVDECPITVKWERPQDLNRKELESSSNVWDRDLEGFR